MLCWYKTLAGLRDVKIEVPWGDEPKLDTMWGNALWRNEELLHKVSHNELPDIPALAESALSVSVSLFHQKPSTGCSVSAICCDGSSY